MVKRLFGIIMTGAAGAVVFGNSGPYCIRRSKGTCRGEMARRPRILSGADAEKARQPVPHNDA